MAMALPLLDLAAVNTRRTLQNGCHACVFEPALIASTLDTLHRTAGRAGP